MNLLQKLLKYLILFFAVCFLIVVLLAGYFRIKIDPYFSQLIKQYATDSYYPKLSETQILQLGWAHSDTSVILFGNSPPVNSYTQFSTKKRGVTRIACIGDSFTMGDELAAGLDFPSQLQEMLSQRESGKFEVINFGTSGYGLTQSSLLLSYIGEGYDLDVLVINLFEHLRVRDNTFKYHEYAPLHARYVLNKNETLEFVPVVGENRRDAIKQYYSFLTKKIYRRYDVKTPAFIKVFNQRFSEYGFDQHFNPFYYYLQHSGKKRSLALDKELALLYKLILEDLCMQYGQVIILCNDPFSLEVSRSANAPNLKILEIPVGDYALSNKALYRMPHFHFSATGAQEVAKEIAHHLLQMESAKGFYAIDSIYPDTTSGSQETLSEFESVLLEIDGKQALKLYLNLSPPQPYGFTTAYENVKGRYQALLALNISKSNDLSFLPLDFVPNDKLSVYLDLNTKNGDKIQTQIGSLRRLNAFIWDMDISIREIEHASIRAKFTDHGNTLVHWEIETTSAVSNATLLLGDKRIPLLIEKENNPTQQGLFLYGLYFKEYAAFRSLDHFVLTEAAKISVPGSLLFQGALTTISIPFIDFVWRSNESDEKHL